MRARDIIGKRVARVVQSRFMLEDGRPKSEWEITEIEFDDGSSVTFSVNEHESDYGVSATYWKPNKKGSDR